MTPVDALTALLDQPCTCDPDHLEVGGYDAGCAVHEREGEG